MLTLPVYLLSEFHHVVQHVDLICMSRVRFAGNVVVRGKFAECQFRPIFLNVHVFPCQTQLLHYGFLRRTPAGAHGSSAEKPF